MAYKKMILILHLASGFTPDPIPLPHATNGITLKNPAMPKPSGADLRRFSPLPCSGKHSMSLS